MPELPEVEVTRRRLEREMVGRKMVRVVVRVRKLRLPMPEELTQILPGQVLRGIERRGKYLIFTCDSGWLLLHLGMTGYLRLLQGSPPAGKHDHLDICFDNDKLLRFHDPRKFGTVVWGSGDPLHHPLLAEIGPEPLSGGFDGAYLFAVSRKRKVPVKQLLMNASVVAGVGNIYANEALFRARIRPDRSAGLLSQAECDLVAGIVREVLEESITLGSSHRVTEESVAYHPLDFKVYGRGGEPCVACGAILEETRLGNRSTVFCAVCQR